VHPPDESGEAPRPVQPGAPTNNSPNASEDVTDQDSCAGGSDASGDDFGDLEELFPDESIPVDPKYKGRDLTHAWFNIPIDDEIRAWVATLLSVHADGEMCEAMRWAVDQHAKRLGREGQLSGTLLAIGRDYDGHRGLATAIDELWSIRAKERRGFVRMLEGARAKVLKNNRDDKRKRRTGCTCDRTAALGLNQWAGRSGRQDTAEPAAASTASAEQAVEATLPALLAQLRTWQDLPDPVYVVAALAVAVVAAETDGEPAWLLIVAPPSSGKTEAVNLLRAITAEHLDDVSIGGLLTWSKGKAPKPTGLLSRVTHGLVTFGDLSALLSNSDRGGRDAVFALLRRVYDGNVDRTIASPGGEHLTWSGRITAVGAVTAAIDDFAAHNSMLGDRWLYVRPPARTTTAARRAARMARHGGLTAARLAGARHAHAVVMAARGRLAGIEVSEALADAIEDAAMVLRWGRAAVKRHGYGAREIDGLPQVEEPPRIIRQLTAVAHGLLALGLDDVATADVCRRLALDSMPAARAAVLGVLAEASDELNTAAVARRAGVDRSVARRNLEELDAIGVVRVRRDGAEPDDEGPDRRPANWCLPDDEDGDLIREVFALVSVVAPVFAVEAEGAG
jgi:hypothetical protein